MNDLPVISYQILLSNSVFSHQIQQFSVHQYNRIVSNILWFQDYSWFLDSNFAILFYKTAMYQEKKIMKLLFKLWHHQTILTCDSSFFGSVLIVFDWNLARMASLQEKYSLLFSGLGRRSINCNWKNVWPWKLKICRIG